MAARNRNWRISLGNQPEVKRALCLRIAMFHGVFEVTEPRFPFDVSCNGVVLGFHVQNDDRADQHSIDKPRHSITQTRTELYQRFISTSFVEIVG